MAYLQKQTRHLVESLEERSPGLQATTGTSFPTCPQASRINISAHMWPKQSTPQAICGKSCSWVELLGEGVDTSSTLGDDAKYFFPKMILLIYTLLQ